MPDPLYIFILSLGSAFLLTLFHQLHRNVGAFVFLATLMGITAISALGFMRLAGGAPAVEILTAGLKPPLSINLRFGLQEAFLSLAVNLVGVLGGWYLLGRLRENAQALILFLMIVMGVNGMIMTRDLFNLFVFIEITAIATYALIGMERDRNTLTAGFKYIMAGGLASSFFLIGTVLIYHLTGTLNIDGMTGTPPLLDNPLGATSLVFLIAAVIIELKPFPANGWGLDVYQSAPSGIGAMISAGVATGALAALHKVLPLLQIDHLPVIVSMGMVTFLFSNLLGLKQENAKRLLGYSSIAQLGLLIAAMAYLRQTGHEELVPLVVGGLFINHFLAKAGLFWLAGVLGKEGWRDWSLLSGRPWLLVLFGTLIFALVGFPPFPGFWAKWELIMQLASGGMYGWMTAILVGSLLEAVYLFRWLGAALGPREAGDIQLSINSLAQPTVFAVLLYAIGWYWADGIGERPLVSFLPVVAAGALFLVDRLPSRLVGILSLLVVGGFTYRLLPQLSGLAWLFGLIFLPGGLLLIFATLYRKDTRRGFYPLLTAMVMALGILLQAQTSLGFFYAWEIMTLSSYLLITLGKDASRHALSYVIFSLASAYLILAGFALGYAGSGSRLLAGLQASGPLGPAVLTLLALGFIVKTGGFGFHIWVPGAYTEAEDDFTAIISSIVSKAGVFGFLVAGIYLGDQVAGGIDVAYLVCWLGLLTALFGALMAVVQEDAKRLLAYSSMGQVGYIVAGVAMMSHLGWVTAIYLSFNHFLYKGLLFLAIAGVIHRTGTRDMYRMGGMIGRMPVTFFCALIAIIAMSGVPPLTGFGGKWLLYNGLIEKHWYLQAGLAFFSSALACLYMFRLLHSVFLGQPKLKHKDVKEAPWWLVAPQLVLAGTILVFSLFPQYLVQPISSAVEPYYASTLHWAGNEVTTAIGHWNGFLVMNIVGAVFLVPLIWIALSSTRVQRVKQFNIAYAAERPFTPETTHFAYNFYPYIEKSMGGLIRPRATRFWDALSEWIHSLAAALRSIYTGHAQTYAQLIVLSLVFMAFMMGGG
jgi:formate hydrogenlyase subunit 3/multisubunit Na+/H+ antiporter MnhD subunit